MHTDDHLVCVPATIHLKFILFQGCFFFFFETDMPLLDFLLYISENEN